MSDFDVSAWARQAFSQGLVVDGSPLRVHRDLTPNDLAGVLHRQGVLKHQVEAWWRVLRDVSLLAEPDDAAPLSPSQSEALSSLIAHDGLPQPIRHVLVAASAHVKTQQDLHTLTYIVVSAAERM